MDLKYIGKVFTLSVSPHMSNSNINPPCIQKTLGPNIQKLVLCMSNNLYSLDITIPNDLDLKISIFPFTLLQRFFLGGSDLIVPLSFTTNIEQIFKSLYISQKFRSSKLKIHLHLGKFFKSLWTLITELKEWVRSNWWISCFWIASYVVVMSKFHRMVEMWSVELRER
jgi:hypothetical protein